LIFNKKQILERTGWLPKNSFIKGKYKYLKIVSILLKSLKSMLGKEEELKTPRRIGVRSQPSCPREPSKRLILKKEGDPKKEETPPKFKTLTPAQRTKLALAKETKGRSGRKSNLELEGATGGPLDSPKNKKDKHLLVKKDQQKEETVDDSIIDLDLPKEEKKEEIKNDVEADRTSTDTEELKDDSDQDRTSDDTDNEREDSFDSDDYYSTPVDTEEEVEVFIMAQPKTNFMNPPIFKGTADEDAQDWLDRYEATARFNHWRETEETLANFGFYLDGAARKWYLCTTKPDHYQDTPGVPAQGGNDPVPAIPGLRSRFSTEFQEENHALFQETKLRNRVQGLEENAVDYYYDVIALCRSVDTNMTEAVKLDYLFRGLKPKLMEKLYTMRPKTCAELLNWMKIYRDAKLMSDRRTWGGAVLGSQKEKDRSTAAPIPVSYLKAEPPKPSESTELMKAILALTQEVAKLKTEVQPKWNPKNATRSTTGKPKCHQCGKIGHIKRNCFANPESENYKGERKVVTPAPATPEVTPAVPIKKVDAVLKTIPNDSTENIGVNKIVLPSLIDLSDMVTETVSCDGNETLANVDTGSGITILTLDMLGKTKYVLEEWTGPRIEMADGTPVIPDGGAMIEIEHPKGTVSGLALVMELKGFEILLGNDFLKKFKKIEINYTDSGNSVTFGEVPEPEKRGRALINKEERIIPEYSMVMLKINDLEVEGGPWLLAPSQKLMLDKALSIGHAIIAERSTTVPVANLSPHPVCLNAGVTLGTLEKFEENQQSVPKRKKKTIAIRTLLPNRIIKSEIEQKNIQDDLTEQMKNSISKNLDEQKQGELLAILEKYKDTFAMDINDLGNHSLPEHTIETGNADLPEVECSDG